MCNSDNNSVKSIKQSDDETSSTEMEVEEEYKLLQRLFFKKYGRALPEKRSDDVDIGIGPKDLTKEQKKDGSNYISCPS